MHMKRMFNIFAAQCVAAGSCFLLGCSDNNSGGTDTESETTKTINGIECVYVSAGTFTMGESDVNYVWWSGPARVQVTLTQGFWIGKYEVTQAQYRAAMGSNPSYFSGDNKPVESVTWTQADAFCKAVGGRLPTEAEWEFAARGGNKSNGYIYSGSNTINNVAWYWGNIPSQNFGSSGYGTQPVGTKAPNELGIYDMTGNVWEWCSDWYSDYSSSAVTNPTGPSTGDYRVLRGGSWYSYSYAGYCRLADRGYGSPSSSGVILGLRVCFGDN